MQVRLPCRAAGQRTRLRQKTRFRVDALNEPVHTLMTCAEPPSLPLFLKAPELLRQLVLHLLAIMANRFTKGNLRIRRFHANRRQLRFAQPHRRAFQCRKQRLIPFAVLDIFQQCHHRADFRNIEISVARVAEHGNALRAEHICRKRCASPRRTHQNNDIAVTDGSFRICFSVVKRRADQLMDASGDHLRLPLDGSPFAAVLVFVPIVLVRALIQDMQLDRRVILPRRQTAEELFAFVVFDFRFVLAHDAAEYGVRRLQHIGTRAEVFLQVNAPFKRSLCQIKAFCLLKKKRRFCLTEAIDALLHVADEKQPVLPRKAADDGFLNRAGILIFVDKDIAVSLVQRVADIGQCQCLERAMLQIVKIQQTALFLGGGVERIIGLDQLCQAIQRRGGHLDIRRRVIRIERKRRLHIADCLFECVAPRLYAVGKRFVEDIRLFLSSQRGK